MREEENKKSSRKNVIRLFPKRRYSVIYLVAGAVILSGAMIYQLTKNTPNETQQQNITDQEVITSESNTDSVPVTTSEEIIKMPVLEEKGVSISKHFYDENGTEKEQQEALVFYDNTYSKNTGTDIVAKDGKAFEVVAALSGTVIKAEKDSLLGNIVEISHNNGVKTVYQSLDDVQIEVGDTVTQGEVIGKAGQNVIGKDLGIHTHFEIRDGNKAVNPETSFNKTISTVKADFQKAADKNKK
jgi:stage II sporulation protein Q